MQDIVPSAVHVKPRCRTKATGASVTPLSAGEQPGALFCPVCKSTHLVWAYRYERPEFRLGAMACKKCGLMYDVTPRN